MEMCGDAGAPNYGVCGLDVQCGAVNVSAAFPPSHPVTTENTVAAAPAAPAAPARAPTERRLASSNQVWIEVDMKLGAAGSNTVIVDLAKLNGASPVALRYA